MDPSLPYQKALMLLHVNLRGKEIRLAPLSMSVCSQMSPSCTKDLHYQFSFFLVSQQIWDVKNVLNPVVFFVQRLTSLTRPNKHMTNTHDSCCAAEWNQNHTTSLWSVNGEAHLLKKKLDAFVGPVHTEHLKQTDPNTAIAHWADQNLQTNNYDHTTD